MEGCEDKCKMMRSVGVDIRRVKGKVRCRIKYRKIVLRLYIMRVGIICF